MGGRVAVLALLDTHAFLWWVADSERLSGPARSERAGRLPGSHRDPFDRMLAAQALAREFPVVSIDPVFDGFGVVRLW